MRNLTEVSTYTANVQVPENGDVVAAETRDPAFQALANRTKFLNDARVAHDARITAVEGRLSSPSFISPLDFPALAKSESLWHLDIGTSGVRALTTKTSAGDRPSRGAALVHRVPLNAQITAVRALVLPGTARATVGNRIELHLERYTGVSFGGTPNPGTRVTEASGTDDGNATLQVIALTGLALAMDRTIVLRLRSGTGDTDNDLFYGVEVDWS